MVTTKANFLPKSVVATASSMGTATAKMTSLPGNVRIITVPSGGNLVNSSGSSVNNSGVSSHAAMSKVVAAAVTAANAPTLDKNQVNLPIVLSISKLPLISVVFFW